MATDSGASASICSRARQVAPESVEASFTKMHSRLSIPIVCCLIDSYDCRTDSGQLKQGVITDMSFPEDSKRSLFIYSVSFRYILLVRIK